MPLSRALRRQLPHGKKRTTTGPPALAPSTLGRTAPGRLDATPVGPDGAALGYASVGQTAPRGNPCPPGAVPPRPSRNDTEERSRPTLPKPRQRGPIYINGKPAERLVQLLQPQRDPDDQPLPAPSETGQGTAPPTSLTLRGPRWILAPGPMLNVPGCSENVATRPLASPHARCGTRFAGAELQGTVSVTYRAAIRRCERQPAVAGGGRAGRKDEAIGPLSARRAVVATDDAPLKRTHEPAQLLDAPGAGLVEVHVDPRQSARARVWTRTSNDAESRRRCRSPRRSETDGHRPGLVRLGSTSGRRGRPIRASGSDRDGVAQPKAQRTRAEAGQTREPARTGPRAPISCPASPAPSQCRQ